jgi:hypothetical protein
VPAARRRCNRRKKNSYGLHNFGDALQPIYSHGDNTPRYGNEQLGKSKRKKHVWHAFSKSSRQSIKLSEVDARKLLIDWSQVRALPAEPNTLDDNPVTRLAWRGCFWVYGVCSSVFSFRRALRRAEEGASALDMVLAM